MIIPEEWYERAKSNGINRSALRKRITQYGWDVEKAITKPLRNKRNCEKLLEKAYANGITAHALYQRLYYGWSEEEAISVLHRERVEEYRLTKSEK